MNPGTTGRNAWYALALLALLGGAADAQDRQAWIERVKNLEPDGIVWPIPFTARRPGCCSWPM